jgi:hypothetical protein
LRFVDGAAAQQRLLTQAAEAEVTAFLGRHVDKLTDNAANGWCATGHLPEREMVTGIGPISVRAGLRTYRKLPSVEENKPQHPQ